MKYILFFVIISLFRTVPSPAQSSDDIKRVYQTIISSFPPDHPPIIDKTTARIQRFDIDGDFDKWFYKRSQPDPGDISGISGSIIDVSPIRYSQTIIDFLTLNGFEPDINALLNDPSQQSLYNLERYIEDYHFTSWKKAPFGRTGVGNIFKRKQVTVLSPVMFEKRNNLALVKIETVSKNKTAVSDFSKIVILQKEKKQWMIIGELKKQSPSGSSFTTLSN